MRTPTTIRLQHQRGGVSIQLLVLMVPVFFGLMGFAVDLGRLYMARGELQTAAQSMALAAAARLNGTEAATTDALDAANRMVENESGYGNRYDYGGLPIGETTGSLNSEIVAPTYFATAAEAIGEDATATGSGEVSGIEARHVRVELVGEVPLLFWRFLSLGQEGKVPIRVRAVAGFSAPLCTVCNIEPIAIAALDIADTVDFGFVVGTRYTLGYSCTGNPIPQALADTAQRIPYLLLNRANDQLTVYADDSQQLYRVGAQGLLPSTTQALACFSVNAEESIWASAAPLACNNNRVNTAITSYLCGMATRMDATLAQGCDTIPEIDTLGTLYQSDTDLNDIVEYSAYIGNGRRLLTIPIVDALNPAGTMIVQGFRQFLLQPLQNQTGIAPNDSNGRIAVTYLGTVFPVKQGRFGDCAITNGPGKVVLHR